MGTDVPIGRVCRVLLRGGYFLKRVIIFCLGWLFFTGLLFFLQGGFITGLETREKELSLGTLGLKIG